MAEIKLTNGHICKVDDDDYTALKDYTWWSWRGYAARTVKTPKGNRTRPMHHDIIDCPAGMVRDHINGDRLDNRKSNLRVCSQRENCYNQGIKSSNSTGYKGVKLNKKCPLRPWIAYIKYYGRSKYIGNYVTKEEAAQAYNEAAQTFFGEFARLNEIKEIS